MPDGKAIALAIGTSFEGVRRCFNLRSSLGPNIGDSHGSAPRCGQDFATMQFREQVEEEHPSVCSNPRSDCDLLLVPTSIEYPQANTAHTQVFPAYTD